MALQDQRKPETIIRSLQRELKEARQRYTVAVRKIDELEEANDESKERAQAAEEALAEWKLHFGAILSRFDVLVAREAAASGGEGGEAPPGGEAAVESGQG